MMSPADLMKMAESLAERIPEGPAFEEERQVSWELVGRGFLRCGDAEGALRALRQLRLGEAQAALRFDFAKWVSAHPESDTGINVLRETVDQIAQWEPWFHNRNFSELIPIVHLHLGEPAVRRIADSLKDCFTKAIVLTTWACLLPDPASRRALLAQAEQVAAKAHPGNRDWALRWVLQGYQASGWDLDAERVRALMERDSDTMDAPIDQAEELIAKVDGMYPSPKQPPDSAAARLSRFLNYRYNDLKIQWLTDQAPQGVSDPDVEAQLSDESFQRIEPPRQPSIHKDPSHLESRDFAAFFFARPVPLRDSDRDLLRGDSRCATAVDSIALVAAAIDLFLNLGIIAQDYSPSQIEQGLWFLFGFPYFFFEELMNDEVPEEMRIACLEAMVAPFRDYYCQISDNYSGSAFYMWWHHLRGCHEHETVLPVCQRVLKQILALPERGCQFAALHGLNHLHPDPAASEIVERYLDEHRPEMTPDDIKWVEMCRYGQAL